MTKKIQCEIFTRTCGYYAPSTRMNLGKREEHFVDRKYFKVE
jgi:anaerobic ribonucleoside-triphosphate reductase